MRPISAWAHMMTNTVTVAPRTALDTYGKPTYGTAVSYKAHISRKRTMVRSPAGQEVESGQQVHLLGSPAVEPSAQLTLSTGDIGSTEAAALHPKIVSVERLFDQNGPHHTVLYL